MRVPTPPMGWNSWNQVHEAVSEDVVLRTARAMVDRGLAAAGYTYVVVDDGWQARARAADGRLAHDPEKFPRGMAYVADEVHALGLKFGIYSAPGARTCAGYPGSIGYEEQDAAMFADWGVDFLKYDWCSAAPEVADRTTAAYSLMRRLLDETGREIILSLSEYGVTRPWHWARGIGDMWRTTYDIWPTWSSIYGIANQQLPIVEYTGPGGWNDPDMLHLGNGDLTLDENRSHMALWCLLAAPLFVGTDVEHLSDELVALLVHPGLLGLNQDPLGKASATTGVDGTTLTLRKPLADGRVALGILNHTTKPAPLTYHLYRLEEGAVDVWTGEPIDRHQVLAPHAMAIAVGAETARGAWSAGDLDRRLDCEDCA